MKSRYNIVKTGFYGLGFLTSIGFIFKDGLTINSHTPSLGFLLPFFIIIIGFVWGVVDLIIDNVFDRVKINFKNHIIGISIYGILIIGMFVYLLPS